MNKRIEYIDIAKGIAIIMVLLGHIDLCPIGLKSSIYSFHMPLFFILSGYFMKEGIEIRLLIKKLFKSLMVPYLIIGGGNAYFRL